MAGYMINPYNNPYGVSYGQPMIQPQQSYAQMPSSGSPVASNILGYQVDGEVGAKSFPMPNGATGPVALWDMNDGVFYLRTFNAAGFPMPLERYRFVKEEIAPQLPAGQSGGIDPSQMVSRSEFDQLTHKIDDLAGSIRNMQNQSQGQTQSSNRNNNGGR